MAADGMEAMLLATPLGKARVRSEKVTQELVAPEGHASRILTPDQRLRIFVSSTLEELATERAAASEVIAALRLTPVLFELGARPHPPRPLYRAFEQSQLFVGLCSKSYGWVAASGPACCRSGT